MKYILFEQSAIDIITGKTDFQSIEFSLGKGFIDFIRGNTDSFSHNELYVNKSPDGIIFCGHSLSKSIIVFDLMQSELLEKEKDDASLLLILQKTLRNAIKTWNRYPFSQSERINQSKSIIFPFIYTDKRRIVIERSTKCERLVKRGITNSLLVYNYTDNDPHKDENPSTDNLRLAGESYLKLSPDIRAYFNSYSSNNIEGTKNEKPLIYETTENTLSSGDFLYLSFEKKLNKLTITQRNVVQSNNFSSPIRIEGPAGSGKTASMILRAFYILEKMNKEKQPFRIIFLSHSESTNIENKNAFSFNDATGKYTNGSLPQTIHFTTLLQYCIDSLNIKTTQVIDKDALDAKEQQRLFIEEAFDKVMKEKHKSYRSLLSNALNSLLDESNYPRGLLFSMLQHEFSIQIKGRTNGTIEEYYNLEPIKNALPIETKKDKEFVFEIFKEYQNMLYTASIYDLDDITVATLSQLNAPIWRRERKENGFDYIFVDEMHLFNINEQYCFHYLTKSPEQKEIPICFALDYSQAIGDRGDVKQDQIEKAFAKAQESNFNTVFRSSQQITDFCAAISASGSLMFQSDYKNPYITAVSGFTKKEEELCDKPELYMYNNEDEMIDSICQHIYQCQKKYQCANKDIAIISFESSLFDNTDALSKAINKDVQIVKTRHDAIDLKSNNNRVFLFDPYSINGLEFKCVILVGVDEGRVPQTVDVEDISQNYLKYIAYNQLYLASSRAKYQLILLGNNLHGQSSCLQYAIENELVIAKQISMRK